MISTCKSLWRTTTPPPQQKPNEQPAKRQNTDNRNQNAAQKPSFQKGFSKPDATKKSDRDVGSVKITELGSDSEDNDPPVITLRV